MTHTSLRVRLCLGVVVALPVLLAGCSSAAESPDPEPTPTPTPTPIVEDAPQSDELLEIPGIPAPAATLSAPEVPVDATIATDNPESFTQFVPPDISLSGIAVAVSSTTADRGQTVRFASQAAPELATHTAYLITGFDPSAQSLATGQVGADGRFTLDYQVQDTGDVVVVIAQAGVPAQAPFVFDEVVARSAAITITRN